MSSAKPKKGKEWTDYTHSWQYLENTDIDWKTHFLVTWHSSTIFRKKHLLGPMGHKDQNFRVPILFTFAAYSFKVSAKILKCFLWLIVMSYIYGFIQIENIEFRFYPCKIFHCQKRVIIHLRNRDTIWYRNIRKPCNWGTLQSLNNF